MPINVSIFPVVYNCLCGFTFSPPSWIFIRSGSWSLSVERDLQLYNANPLLSELIPDARERRVSFRKYSMWGYISQGHISLLMGRFVMAVPVCSSKPNFRFKHSFLCTSTRKDHCAAVNFLLSYHHLTRNWSKPLPWSGQNTVFFLSLLLTLSPVFFTIHAVVLLELGYFCITLLVIDLSELQVSIRFVIIDASCHIWVCANNLACAQIFD